MPILYKFFDKTGQIGIKPRRVSITTTDSLATVTTAGYLSEEKLMPDFLYPTDIIDMVYDFNVATGVGTYGQFLPVFAAGIITLNQESSDIITPTIANHFIISTNTTGTIGNTAVTAIQSGSIQAGLSGTAGTLISYPSTAAKGSLIVAAVANTGNTNVTVSNAAHGQATVYSIPDCGATTANLILSKTTGTQHITVGSLQADAGSMISGISTGGTVGLVKAFPTTATSGFVAIQAAVNGGGDFGTTISNATTQGQAQVITVPDAGAATANFLLDTGTANIIAKQEFVGLTSVLNYSAGTWTRTRVAQGNYAQVKTQGDDTTIIGIDITPQIRVAASKGFRLDSFDVIYSIATLALDAHSIVLDRIAYANNVAVSVTSIPVTVTLATATQAQPYLTNGTVTTPAFDITADSKYVFELTVNAGATSDYSFFGLMLRFSETVA